MTDLVKVGSIDNPNMSCDVNVGCKSNDIQNGMNINTKNNLELNNSTEIKNVENTNQNPDDSRTVQMRPLSSDRFDKDKSKASCSKLDEFQDYTDKHSKSKMENTDEH